MDIKGVLLQYLIYFLIPKLIRARINFLVVVVKMRIFQIKNYLKNYTNQLLETLGKEYTMNFCREYLGCSSC